MYKRYVLGWRFRMGLCYVIVMKFLSCVKNDFKLIKDLGQS